MKLVEQFLVIALVLQLFDLSESSLHTWGQRGYFGENNFHFFLCERHSPAMYDVNRQKQIG